MKKANILKDSIAVEIYKEDGDKQKEREALLKKAPDNELLKKMIEKKDPEKMQEKYNKWDLVDDICYCARDMYMQDNKPINEVVSLMIEALEKIKE